MRIQKMHEDKYGTLYAIDENIDVFCRVAKVSIGDPANDKLTRQTRQHIYAGGTSRDVGAYYSNKSSLYLAMNGQLPVWARSLVLLDLALTNEEISELLK